MRSVRDVQAFSCFVWHRSQPGAAARSFRRCAALTTFPGAPKMRWSIHGARTHPLNIGPIEIAIVLILALLVLGPKRLPQAGRSLGQAMRELKKATSTAHSDLGLDDVAADVKDLKSSLSIDLKDTDQPAPAKPKDDAAAGEAPDTAEEAGAPKAPEAPPEPSAPAAAPAPDDA